MLKKILFAALFGSCCVATYHIGCVSQQKETEHYMKLQLRDNEAASRMSDAIRCHLDNLMADSLTEEYNSFEETLSVFLLDDGIGHPINIEDYSYCY